MERMNFRLGGILVIALVVATILVQARPAVADTYLIQTYAYAESYANGWLTITDSGGNTVLNSSVYQSYDSASQYFSDANKPAGFDYKPFVQFGDPTSGPVGNWMGWANTQYGTNQVKVGLSGIMSNQTASWSFTDTQGNSANINVSAGRYVYAVSQWQDLFLLTLGTRIGWVTRYFSPCIRCLPELV